MKLRKHAVFVIDSYFKDSALTALKNERGYHLSIEGIRNWYLFREKWYIKARVRGWTSGGASSHKHLLSTPPPPLGVSRPTKSVRFPRIEVSLL